MHIILRNIFNRLRVVIEGWNDRKDRCSGFGGCCHVANMDEVQGCFADAEDEAAAFFEAHIRGAFNEVAGEAVGDASKRTHGAGEYDHGVDGAGAGSDGSADIFVGQERDPGGVMTQDLLNELMASGD